MRKLWGFEVLGMEGAVNERERGKGFWNKREKKLHL